MSFNLDDYVDVAERLRLFYEKYPDGRISRLDDPHVMVIDGQSFVVYSAVAYRTPEDPKPAVGTAWEPFPGKTQFTRDSELMNAETAAWGRAIVAAGIPAQKIASRQEVAARQGNSEGRARMVSGTDKPTDKQLSYLRKLVKEHDPPADTIALMLKQVGAHGAVGEAKWTTKLNKQQTSDLIEAFKSGALPTGTSDVTPAPADVPWSEDYDPAAAPEGAPVPIPSHVDVT